MPAHCSAAAPTAEEAQKQRLSRYQELVDRKYLGQLSAAEQEELERLGREIDSFYDAFYEPGLESLRARLR